MQAARAALLLALLSGNQPLHAQQANETDALPDPARRCDTLFSEQEFQRLDQRGFPLPLNRVALSGTDGVRWNGSPVSLATLGRYLELVTTLEPTPLVVVRVAPETDPALLADFSETVRLSMRCTPDLP